MKTMFLFLFMFFLINSLNAQLVIEGIVVDKETNLPLHGATVIIKDKNIGTTTDADGYFRLSLHDVDVHDTIVVSYLGYYQFLSPVYNLSENIIKLVVRDFTFDEVTVKPSFSNLKDLMEKVVRKYNETRREDPHIAKSHYREKAIFDDKFIMYNESLGYSLFLGERDRVAPLANYKFIYENTRISKHSPEWEPAGTAYWERIPLGGTIPLNVFRYFETNGLLENHDFEKLISFPKYRYRLDSTYYINNQLVYRINFSPTIFNLIDRKEGTIDVNTANLNILKIDYSSSNIWSTLYHDRVEGRVVFEFQYYNDQPYLSNSAVYYEEKGYTHEAEFNVLIQKFDRFEVEDEDFWNVLYLSDYPFISYNKKEWEKYNVQPDENIEKVTNDLRVKGQDLTSQFEENSGEWYIKPYGSTLSRIESGREILKTLKQFF